MSEWGNSCASYRVRARETGLLAAFARGRDEGQACATFGIHRIHTGRCSKELEKRSRSSIIFSLTCYRNGARGGRVGNRVICSGAAPSSPRTGHGALPAPGS